MATQVSHSGVGERIAKVSALSGVLAIAVLGSMVLADPQGEQVIRGDVNFTRDGALTTIRAGDNSIINYQKFDIGRQETVRFIQPDATSRVLNRVTGPDPSRFEGTLLANGRVYFVNPAGVFFANGALVNAAGLYAAAGHMSDQDFLRGMNRFTNVTGQVMNYGTINASEFVHLVGARVGNLGSIVVPGGVVTMTAGREVYLSELNGHILVKVEGADATAAASPAPGVENAGTISAPGGQVQLGAGDMYSLAIRNTGAIKAKDIALEGGAGGVVKVAGVLDASDRSPGAKGGTVKVLGEKIAVGGARVDASGDAGGGTVLIGGGYQGKAADIRNALRTNVGEGTVIAADAVTRGDGGTVVVWSDQVTRFSGSIFARGGADGGNGGTVETSGKMDLAVSGAFVETRAPGGRTGVWLLDPHNVTINNSGDKALLDVDQFLDTPAAPAGDVAINAGTINGAGANVTIQANNDITVDSTGAINISTAGVTLTLQAGRSILVNANVITNHAAISMTANETVANGVQNANRDAGAAAITMATGTAINAGSANITLTVSTGAGLTYSTSGDITLEGLSTTTGHVLIVNNGPTAGSGIVSASGNQLITAASAALDVNGAGGGGEIGASGSPIRVTVTNLEARSQSAGAFFSSPTAGVTLGGATLGGLTGVSTSSNGNIAVTAPGTITVSEAISANGSGTVTLTATGTSSDIVSSAAIGSGSGLITLQADDDVTLNSGGTVGASTTGPISINADNDASGAGTLTIASGSGIGNASAAAIALQSNAIDVSATVRGASTLTLQPSLAGTSVGLGTGAGTFSLTSTYIGNLADGFTSITVGRSDGTAAVTINGGVTFTDPVTVQSAGVAGSIALSSSFSTAAANAGITFSAGTGNSGSFTQNAAATIAAGNAAITISADSIALGGSSNSITTTGALTLQPQTVGRPIVLAAAGAATDFALAAAEIQTFSETDAALGSVTIGRADGTHAVTVNAVTFNDPLTIQAPASGGSITLAGALANNAAVTLTAGDAIALNASTGINAGAGTITIAANADASGAQGFSQGATSPIQTTNTSVNAVSITVNTVGGGTGNASIRAIQSGSGGTITINSRGGSIVENAAGTSAVSAGTGTVSLTATGAATSVGASGSAINTTAGTITAAAGTGGIYVTNTTGATFTATSSGVGPISLAATGSMVITDGGVSTGSGAVSLTATSGSITSATINGTADVVSSGTITLATVTSGNIGTANTSGNELEINGGTLAASTAGGGFINVLDTTGGLTMSSGSGSLRLVSTGATLAVASWSSGSGNIALIATGATSDVTVAAGVTVSSTGGAVSISAGRSVTLTGTGSVSTSGTGTIGITATAGNITTGAGGISAGTGLVSLSAATGINATTVITNLQATNSTSGTIVIANTGALTVTGSGVTNNGGGGSITASSPLTISSDVLMAGDFTLEAGSGASLVTRDDLTIAANVTSTSGGTITLRAGDNIIQNSGTITSTAGVGARTVLMTADTEGAGVADVFRGGITQNGGGINANVLTVSANTGSAMINVTNAVNSFSATNTAGGSGAITLTNIAAPLTITGITQSAGASVTVNNTGAVTVSGAISTGSGGGIGLTATGGTLTLGNTVTAGGSGTVTLAATVATSDVLFNSTVSSTSGTVGATAGRSVTLNAGSVTTSGNVNLTGTAGTVSEAGAGVISGALLTTISATGTTLNNPTNTVTSFNATNTTSGGIALTNTAAPLTITGITQTPGAGVTVGNTGAITTTGAISTGSGGAIGLTATGTLTVGNTVTAGGAGIVTLTSTGVTSDVALNSTVASTSGAVNVTAGRTLTLNGNVTTTGTDTLTATVGAISRTAGTVSGTNLALSAATGIGASGAGASVTTAVSNLEAGTGAGGIFVDNTGTLGIGGVTVSLSGVQQTGGAGNIQIVNTGSVSIVTNVEIVRNSGTGDVTIQANGAGSDLLTGGTNGINNGAVVATAGGVNLSAGRDMLLGNTADHTYGDVQAIGGSMVLAAGRDLIVDENAYADVRGGAGFTLTGTAVRDIALRETGLVAAHISTSGGTLILTAGGSFSSTASTTIGSTYALGSADQDAGTIGLTASTGSVALAGSVTAGGGAASAGNPGRNGGSMTISAPLGSVAVGSVTTAGSNASFLGGAGGNGGNMTLQEAAGTSLGGLGIGDWRPDGIITLNGTLTLTGGTGAGGANGTRGNLSLGPAAPRTNTPSVATVYRPSAAGNLTLNVNNLTMAQNEKLTVLGSLTINGTGTLALGDIATMGSMTISTTGSIQLVSRPAGAVVQFRAGVDTLVQDRGLDFVAGGAISFSPGVSPANVTGGGPTPWFADNSGVIPSVSGMTTLLYAGTINASTLFSNSKANDLLAEGTSAQSVSASLSVLPQTEEVMPVSEETVGPAFYKQLESLGIYARTMRVSEFLEALKGSSLFDDLAGDKERTEDRDRNLIAGDELLGKLVVRPPERKVVDRRLSGDVARRAIANCTAFLAPRTVKKDGKEETIYPTDRMLTVLRAAATNYKKQAKPDADEVTFALGFRKYVETTPSEKEALEALNGFRGLFQQIALLGLTSVEIEVSRKFLLGDFEGKVGGMNYKQLVAAIMGASPTMVVKASSATGKEPGKP